MTTKYEKFRSFVDNYLGTTYKKDPTKTVSTPSQDAIPEIKIDWLNMSTIFIAIVLLITAWIILLIIINKLGMLVQIGNRSQEECGKTYMELETARNRIFMEYKASISKSLNTINAIITTVVSIIFAITFANMVWNIWDIRKQQNLEHPKRNRILIAIFVILIISSVAVFIPYVQQNSLLRFDKRYKETTDKISYTGSVTTTSLLLFVLALSFAMIIYNTNSLAKDGYIIKKSTAVWYWIVLTVIVFCLAFMTNTNSININNRFMVPYANATREINKNIELLRKLDCSECIMKDNKKINSWMNTMLARNIKRANPEEEEGGDPLQILESEQIDGTNKYISTLYAYLENSFGKELEELPDNIEDVKQFRKNIRIKMRELRNNDTNMIQPVKSFVMQITSVTMIAVGILSFIVFHSIYRRSPTIATIVVTILSILLISITLFLYSWNTGRGLYI